MQRIVTGLFITCFYLSLVTNSTAATKPVPENPYKSFNLNLGNNISSKAPPADCCHWPENGYDAQEPSAGEQNLVERMKLRPEFHYGKYDEDYNNLNIYDTQVKLNVGVPVDIDF